MLQVKDTQLKYRVGHFCVRGRHGLLQFPGDGDQATLDAAADRPEATVGAHEHAIDFAGRVKAAVQQIAGAEGEAIAERQGHGANADRQLVAVLVLAGRAVGRDGTRLSTGASLPSVAIAISGVRSSAGQFRYSQPSAGSELVHLNFVELDLVPGPRFHALDQIEAEQLEHHRTVQRILGQRRGVDVMIPQEWNCTKSFSTSTRNLPAPMWPVIMYLAACVAGETGPAAAVSRK